MTRITVILLMLCFSFTVSSQSWECKECPKRNIGLFDLDVQIENPAETDSSIAVQIAYQNWVELFMVAGSIHNALFNDDPSKECLNYYDGQMAIISTLELTDQTYQLGKNTPFLPPSAGTIDGVNYWVSGVIANRASDGLTIIKVYIQASGTGETVAETSALYDYNISGLENGTKVAQQLMPLMEKIRDFEKRKRDEEERIAIGPYEGATLELKPAKDEIEPGEKVDVTVRLLDCDDVPLKNMQVRLEARGGTFNPEEVTTNDSGEATTKFTADDTPGKYAQPFEFEFRYPFASEFYTSGDEGYITIVPADYEAKITISKNHNRVLQTNKEDSKKEYVDRHHINETISAEYTIYLSLIERQEMPLFDQTWEYYQPQSVNLSSFNCTYRETRYNAGPNYETNVEITRVITKSKIDGKEYMSEFPPWILVIDNETKKAVKLIPAGYGIEYEYNETEEITSVQGNKKETKTTTKKSTKSFKLGPVGEEIPDPTIKESDTWIQDYLKKQGVELPAGVPIPKISNEETREKIQPDILVSSGNGETGYGGRGTRHIEKKLEFGFEKTDLSYDWHMTINKKK